MNILLANDDGIAAKGLHLLADCLSKMEEVENIYIVAPDRQRSCCGHSLSLFEKVDWIKIDEAEFGGKVRWVYSCSGSPADCVRSGIYFLKEQGVKLDLVCSGINHGSNWGTDVYYSGTMSAAREACVCFTQAIAFSLCNNAPVHFEYFPEFVPQVIRKTFGKLPHTTILNVNVPDLPVNELKGIRVCKQGPVDYGLGYKKTLSNACGLSFEFDGGKVYRDIIDKDWDCIVGMEGYVTLTPIDLMPYSKESMDAVSALGIEI